MAAHVCLGCGTVYAADLEKCPHCEDTARYWDYEDPPAPPKIKAKGKGVGDGG